MNNKILSAILLAGISVTGFASVSSANESNTGSITDKLTSKFTKLDLTDEQKESMTLVKDLMIKQKSGETLTADEEAQLEELKSTLPERGGKMGGKRGGGKMGGKMGMDSHLTDEEKVALESMTDEEKNAFMETKKAEKMAEKEASKAVIDKLIAGETLSSEEEAIRSEMIAKFAESSETDSEKRSHGKGKGGQDKEIIMKIVNGETLTAEETATIQEMQAKHAEREEKMATIKPILEKKKAGTELTAEETATLEAFGADRKDGHDGGKKGGKRGDERSDKMEQTETVD